LQQTQAETDKLLKERAQLLAKAEKDHENRLIPIDKSISELQAKLKKLSHEKLSLENEKTTLEAEIDSKRQILSELNQKTDSVKAELEDIRAKHSGVQANITSLTDKAAKLTEHNSELSSQNDNLVQKNRALIIEYESNQAKFESQTIDNKRILDNQRAEIRDNSLRLEEESKIQEEVRSDLAARLRAVEEREKTVKIREHKVDRDQAKISRNADLLEL